MSDKKERKLAIFEGKKIRRHWDEKREKWYFSVTDIIAVLIEQPDFKKAQSYWTTLKSRLKQEGNESVTKCDKLKLRSADGKYYKTDVADVETLLRLIQSIPSPKTVPIKLWLATHQVYSFSYVFLLSFLSFPRRCKSIQITMDPRVKPEDDKIVKLGMTRLGFAMDKIKSYLFEPR